jgi:hypothetical protein
MDKQAIKELMYGGIAELMRNRDYYYRSSVGYTYSNWTEAGIKALADYMGILGYKLLEIEEKELHQQAKDMVIRGLKGEQI